MNHSRKFGDLFRKVIPLRFAKRTLFPVARKYLENDTGDFTKVATSDQKPPKFLECRKFHKDKWILKFLKATFLYLPYNTPFMKSF